MRRMILITLVLLPVMAHAQARTSTVTQPSPSSAVNEAELIQPVAATELAMKAAGSSTSMPLASNTTMSPLVYESVLLHTTQDFADAALMKAGTLEFSMRDTPTESSAPKVTRAVEVSLSTSELAEQPAVSKVVVHAIVDENGFPRNVAVTQSGGRLIDRRAVEAVNQYRFAPATLDNKATWSTVSLAIRIQKQ
jgi:outer membrane biosynthesis protein TonB